MTIGLIILLFVFGLPTIAKFAAFLTNLKQSTEVIEQVDTTPPAPPRIDLLPEFTNKTKTEIQGNTEPGTNIVFFLNNKKGETLANKNGAFSLTLSLNEGENTFSILAKDASGNESQKSKIFKIIFDNVSPELEINKPEDGTEFFGAKQRQIVIEGKTEENASVKINDRIVVVNEDGSFVFVTTLSEGENKFTIKTQDRAGNESEKSLTTFFFP